MSKGANVTPRVLSVRAASSLDEKVALTSAHTTSHATSPPSLGHLRDASRESGPKVGSGDEDVEQDIRVDGGAQLQDPIHGIERIALSRLSRDEAPRLVVEVEDLAGPDAKTLAASWGR